MSVVLARPLRVDADGEWGNNKRLGITRQLILDFGKCLGFVPWLVALGIVS
jgi:hypothetical protein